MRCIVLYGPPAVGKYTVAQELAKLIDARIMNAGTLMDAVKPFIDRSNPEFIGLVYSLQLQILNATMRLGTHTIIFTCTFSAQTQPDVALIQTVLEVGTRHNVPVELIHLTAKKHTLLERGAQESRKAAGKLTDPNILKTMLDQYDLENPYPYAPSITINTTHLTPQEAAQQIVRTTKPI